MTRFPRHRNPLRWSVVAVVLLAVLALPSLSGGAPASSSGLKAYYDPTDAGTPLDLIGARFGQTASTDITLLLRTEKPWASSVINAATHTTLCILLRSDAQANPAGRLCIFPSASTKSKLSLRYTVLDQQGTQLGIRDLAPVVSRPNDTTVKVSFPPALLRLKPGLYHWKARSQHVDDTACPGPAGCDDLLPNSGENDLTITIAVDPAARERCFGAASRDLRVACHNPQLAHEVVPKPEVAVITPNLPCSPLKAIGLIFPCEFGVPAEDARSTVALIGDSHAAHWRSALELVAQTFKWRGLSITRSGCPFTKATARLDPASRRSQCTRWNAEVPSWLRGHPEVKTVFVVAHFDAGIIVRRGEDEFAAKIRAYAGAWKTLPSSVTRVIVIRDTPKSRTNTLTCVSRAVARHQRAGDVCAIPRRRAISRDAAIVAATRMHSAHVQTIDMTSYFCNNRKCFPVVGGALVYKDVSHLTDVYASSLGPFLLRKVRALNAGR